MTERISRCACSEHLSFFCTAPQALQRWPQVQSQIQLWKSLDVYWIFVGQSLASEGISDSSESRITAGAESYVQSG